MCINHGSKNNELSNTIITFSGKNINVVRPRASSACEDIGNGVLSRYRHENYIQLSTQYNRKKYIFAG
jgi:hypothetical protein